MIDTRFVKTRRSTKTLRYQSDPWKTHFASRTVKFYFENMDLNL